MKHLLIIFLLMPSPLFAWSLREVSSEVSYIRNKRDAYMPAYSVDPDGLTRNDTKKEEWLYGLGLNVHLDVFKYKQFRLFWNNHIFTDGTDSQVRNIGWKWRLGFPLSDNTLFYHYHESRHCADCNADAAYPHENRYVIKHTFLSK